jgi:hypothetical protein
LLYSGCAVAIHKRSRKAGTLDDSTVETMNYRTHSIFGSLTYSDKSRHAHNFFHRFHHSCNTIRIWHLISWFPMLVAELVALVFPNRQLVALIFRALLRSFASASSKDPRLKFFPQCTQLSGLYWWRVGRRSHPSSTTLKCTI